VTSGKVSKPKRRNIKHFRITNEARPDKSLPKTTIELRGLRSLLTTSDGESTASELHQAADRYNAVLVKAFEVLDATDEGAFVSALFQAQGKAPDDSTETKQIISLYKGIIERHSAISEVGTAAGFLLRAYELSTLLGEANRTTWDAVFELCVAFHWLHMEVFDEHARAVGGAKAAANLAAAATGRIDQRHQREEIVRRICETAWSSHPLWKAPRMVERLGARINESLKGAGHKAYTTASLTKVVQRLARER
jgi:hypothetical protein